MRQRFGLGKVESLLRITCEDLKGRRFPVVEITDEQGRCFILGKSSKANLWARDHELVGWYL